MSLHVCVLGIDGSGKSTVAAALPSILAAETGCVVGSAGSSPQPECAYPVAAFCDLAHLKTGRVQLGHSSIFVVPG